MASQAPLLLGLLGIHLFCIAWACDSPRVTSISPKYGSANGATKITINGCGFSRDQFSNGNNVSLQSDTHVFTCDVHKDGTNEVQIQCYTRPMPLGVYFVKIWVDGNRIIDAAHCQTNPNNCKYEVSNSYTPTIDTIEPASTDPGTVVTATGKFFSNRYGSNMDASSNGKTQKVLRVYCGGQECALRNLSAIDENYGFYLFDNGTSDNGELKCKMGGTFVGLYNCSMILESPYGRTKPSRNILRISATERIYMIQTYAEVTGVSPTSGSKKGGTLLTITGKNFDNTTAPLKILVGNAVCDQVGAFTQTEIKCRVREMATPAPSGFPGGRGVVAEVWTNSVVTDFKTKTLDTAAAGYSTVAVEGLNFTSTEAFSGGTIVRMRGYFRPPRDGTYKFIKISDAQSVFYLSTDASEGNKAEYASNTATALNGGRNYYIEARMFADSGTPYVYISSYREETNYLEDQSVNAKAEKQRVLISSDTQYEIQGLDLESLSDSSFSGTSTVQKVTISVDDATKKYRLLLHGVSTDWIDGSATADNVKDAINENPILKDDPVTVRKAGLQYTITFPKKLGCVPAMQVKRNVDAPDGFTVSVTVTTDGVSPSSQIRLDMEGVPSSVIDKDVSKTKLKTSLLELYSALCPKTINTAASGVTFAQDFESSSYEDKEEPFCGRRSAKNPRTIDFGKSKLVSYFKQLCYAFKGGIRTTVRLNYYRDKEDTIRTIYKTITLLPSQNLTDRWYYTCFDMDAALSGETNAKVKSVRFLKGASDFYIDALTVRTTIPYTDMEVIPEMRRVPPNQGNVPLLMDDISVSKSGSRFNVTMKPLNCAHDLKLLSVHGVAKVSGNIGATSNAASFRDSKWQASSTISVQRFVSASKPPSGEFDLSFKGISITGIQPNSTDSEMRDMLLTAQNEMGQVQVTRTGTCAGFNWVIKFISKGGNQPQITANAGKLRGTGVTLTTSTVQDGGAHYAVTPEDMLLRFNEKPQVEVVVNNLFSKCSGTCTFEQTDAQTPTVTGVTPTTGSGTVSVQIAGTGFHTTPANNAVSIGNSLCTVTAATATQLTCTLSNGEGGPKAVSVNVVGKGKASGSVFFTYTGSVTSIAPTTGGLGGGVNLTITGTGFDPDATVTVGVNSCPVLSRSLTSLVCRVPASSGNVDAAAPVVVTQTSGNLNSPTDYQYATALTATVTAVDVTTASCAGGPNATITGNGFGVDEPEVFVGSAKAVINSHSDTEIKIRMPPNTQGTHALKVKVPTKGDAVCTANIVYDLSVTNAYPLSGSLVGGTKVTIVGQGFGSRKSPVSVKFGHSECSIDSISNTQIDCTTGSSGRTHTVENDGEDATNGKGYSWNPPTISIEVGDTVVWKWTAYGDREKVKYKIQQVQSATSRVAVAGGIDSGAALPSGTFNYTFTQTGVYFLDAGDGILDGKIIMRGEVRVVDVTNKALPLSVQVGPALAPQTLPGSTPAGSPACAPFSGLLPDCTDSEPTSNVTDRYVFRHRRCLTPIIANVSGTQMDGSETLTVDGSGFGTACQTHVEIGRGRCTVTSISATRITCSLADLREPIATALDYKVRLDNLGYALNHVRSPLRRLFFVKPHIGSFSPTQGSEEGGTRLVILGGGFSSDVDVSLDSTPCQVVFVNYTRIECITGASVSTATLSVTVSSHVATCRASNNCQYTYASAVTPVVSAMSPSNTNAAVSISITGQRLGSDASDLVVTFGEHQCSVTSATDTSLSCQLPNIPAGQLALRVNSKSRGDAKIVGSLSLTAQLTISSLSPTDGSTEGGTRVTVTGSGYPSNITSVTATLGGQSCSIVSSSLTQLVLITPKLAAGNHNLVITVSSITTSGTFQTSAASTPSLTGVTPTTGASGQTLTLTGQFLTGTPTVAVGGRSCSVTASSTTSITCTAPANFAGTTTVKVDVPGKGLSSGSVNYVYQLAATSMTPTSGGTVGGQNITIMTSGFDPAATNVTVCGRRCDVFTPTQTDRLICKTPVSAVTTGTEECDVVVHVNDQTATIPGKFTYDASLTATVTAVSPTRGGTAGGTTVTITGTNFAATGNLVRIGESVCAVQSESATSITCLSSPASRTGKVVVQVYSPTKGNAAGAVEFFFVDVWSSRFTWGGRDPPTDGDLVTIQKDQVVLLDTDTKKLKMLLINGGKLMFDRKDVTLWSESILITHNGSLEVGTEDEPFLQKATIILEGSLRAPELPIYGAKVLGVREGTLDLHGKPITTTWTTLDQTANAGSTSITLKVPVDWEVGNKIVLASTGERHSQRENEEHEIAAISADKRTLTLTQPLAYKHISVKKTLPTGQYIELAGEVGLLTRNVKVMGSDDKQWHDKIEACPDGFDTGEFAVQTCFQGRHGEEIGNDQFGGHIMMHTPDKDSNKVIGRLSYVEITYMGQAFRLGRYPVHFHLNGDNRGAYVKGCAIHKTFNRAINIHGTHHVRIEQNVVYNVMGGALFLEDGIEHGNVFEYNLAVFVKQSTSLLNDDITPAAFWCTNPNNTYMHNHAAGGTHFGFWYRMHDHPDGPSFDPNFCPKVQPMARWFNNSVHSQGWFGIWIFEEMYPTSDGKCGSTNWSNATFDGLVAWNNEKGYECVFCGDVQLANSILVNNEKAGIEGKMLKHNTQYSPDGHVYRTNTIVAHLDEMDPPKTGCTNGGIVAPFGSGLYVEGINFVNFDKAGCTAITVTSIDGICKFLCGGFPYHYSNMAWHSSPNRGKFRWHSEAIHVDLDGTLTGGTPNSKVVPKVGILDPSKCTDIAAFSIGSIGASLCIPSVNFTRFAFKEVSPPSLNVRDACMQNQFGSLVHQYAFKRLTHKPGYMCLLPTKDTYRFFFIGGSHVTNVTYNGLFYHMTNEWVIINHNFTQTPDRYSLHSSMAENRIHQTIDPAADSGGTMYLNNATNDLFYLVKGTGNVPVKPNFYRCYFPQCISPPDASTFNNLTYRPSNAKKWSDASTWAGTPEGWGGNNNGSFGVPTGRSKVKIPAGTWVVLDMQPAPFTELIVEGVLEFEPGPKATAGGRRRRSVEYHDFHIEATVIVVTGRLIVGWEDNPMKGNVKFTFSGHHRTPDYPITAGPPLGSKGIGAFGRVEMFGIKRSHTWTKLRNSASAGANSIKVRDIVDWPVNSEVVIVTSDMDPLHSEVRRVTAVTQQSDGTVLTLNETLKHAHITGVKTFGTHTLDVAAEVGLLSHNIVIEGEDTPQTESESFGARILISKMVYNDEVVQGMLRMDSVEFLRAGQNGWDAAIDSRFAVSFISTGDLSSAKKSYVRNCGFHHIYSHAIGVFDTDGVDVINNTIHRTIGEAISIEGGKTSVIGNLAVTNLHLGTYRQDVKKDTWPGSISINLAKEDIILRDNVVAGAERSGFRTKGESCGDATATGWRNNVAHSNLIGVTLLIDKRFPAPRAESGHSGGCSRVRNFVAYLNYDYGIYFQEQTDVLVENVIVSDSRVGLFPFVVGASPLAHINKNHSCYVKNSAFIGHSEIFPCSVRNSLAASTPNVRQSGNGRGYNSVDGGYIGVVWAVFSSGPNNAPDKSFTGLKAYNTIGGRHDMDGVTFANFKSSCTGGDRVFVTHKNNDDAIHPAYFKGTQLINVDNDKKIYFYRPRISKINPADCVDMDCDGLKKALIKDLDGKFIGEVGDVIAESEFEWGTNPKRGLGDYRIPKIMLHSPSDVRLDPNVLYPNKGIIRNSACKMMTAWQAYKCAPNGYDYQYVVVESLDSDTEKRRLSPVAIATENAPANQGYIDLINGPQDHGWCFGYTCQKRISTFSLVVASNKDYIMYFSSTNPDNLRLFMINNPDNSKAIRIGIYYAKPNRLDVYADNKYIMPTNGEMQNGKLITKRPTTPGEYMPTVSSPLGANFLDREWRQLYVVLRGNGVVEIRRQKVVVIGFGVPAMTVDEFFGSNIVKNLAFFLGVPDDKIRVVDVIPENSVGRRRRRSTGVRVTLEIGDPVSNATLNGTSSNTTTTVPGSLSSAQLANISTTLVNAAQTGTLNTALNTSVSGITVQTAAESMDSVPSTRSGTSASIVQPVAMRFTSQPNPSMEQNKFNVSVHFVDSSGNVVPSLGTAGQPWVAKLSLRVGSGSSSSQLIIPNDTATFVDGYANFSNLYFNSSGSGFIIDVNVTSPSFAVNFTVASSSLTVTARQLAMSAINPPTSVTSSTAFSINLLVSNKGTTDAAQNLDWKGHTQWTVTMAVCSFQSASIPSNAISGSTTATVNIADATVVFANIAINTASKYHLCFTLNSDPSGYSASYEMSGLSVMPKGYTTPTVTKTSVLRLRFTNSYSLIRGNETQFTTSVYNSLAFLYSEVVFSNIAASEGSVVTTMNVGGTEASVDSTLSQIHSSVSAGTFSVSHNGVTYASDGTMYVDGVVYTGGSSAVTTVSPVAIDTSMPPGTIAAIVICCLLIVAGAIAGGGYYYYKNYVAINKEVDSVNIKDEDVENSVLNDLDSSESLQESGKVIDEEHVKSIQVSPMESRVASPLINVARENSVFLEVGSRPPTGFSYPRPVAEMDQQLEHMNLESETTFSRPQSGLQSTRLGDSPASTPTPAW